MTALYEQTAQLPLEPGVYLFKDPEGTVLYVGKAVRLRERVRSYFAKEIGRGPAIDQMVQEAVTIDHQTSASEMEALLLEARLIRQYKPKYNIRLRDDKSFALIRIDLSEPFPAIYISREKELEELLARKKRARAGVGKVSQKVDQQEFFGPYLSAYSVKMALKSIRQIWPFRDCGPSKYASYAKLGHGCIFATLQLCDAPCAAKISLEEYRENINQIRAFLRGDRETLLRAVQAQMETAAQGEQFERAAKLRDRLQSLLHLQEVAQTRRSISREQQGVSSYNPETDLRFECVDISNNQGSYAVGSVISGVVREGKTTAIATREAARQHFYLDRSRYRKFRIKTVEGVSDTDMLREVLTRRLKRGKNEEGHWRLPDLIIIDGGKGQLGIVEKVRADLGLTEQVAVATVAKGPTRKRVDLYGSDWSQFGQLSQEAKLLLAELLREEAHRFAISYYRRSHRKGLTG